MTPTPSSIAIVFGLFALVGCDGLVLDPMADADAGRVAPASGPQAMADSGVAPDASHDGAPAASAPDSGTSVVAPSTTRIVDSTDGEASGWCVWWIGTAWAALDPTPGPTSRSGAGYPLDGSVPGYVDGYSGIGCFTPELCIVRPTVDDCVANLRVAPCDATIGELDACINDMIAGHKVGADCEFEVSAPCDGYRSHATCRETIVQPMALLPSLPSYGCGIRVK